MPAATTSPRTTRLARSATAPLEARLLAAGPHVESVLDVGTTAGGDLLLVLQEAPVPLPVLLAGPRTPTAGEAVTLLAPLSSALARMHDAGVAHGAATGAAVRLDDDGTPLWCGFELAVLRRVAGARAFDGAVAADRAAFAGFVTDVLARSGPAGRAAAPRLAGLPPRELAEALFDVAEPTPIVLRAGAGEPAHAAPGRLAPVLDPGESPAAEPVRGTVLRRAAARLRAVLAPVRPRVWITAGLAVALLAGAVALLPSSRPEAGAASRTRAPAATAAAPAREVAPRSLRPTAAAAALVEARARCLAASDGGCLARVDAAGSPAAASDAIAVRAGTAPGSPHGAAALRWAAGGTALVRFADGSDVLLVREPGGWRLRDVLMKR